MPRPLQQLREIFEEAKDKKRFVGDTMFWKYYEDIDTDRIYHTDSVEYMNLKVMFWETVFYICLLVIFTVYVFTLQNRVIFDAREEQELYWSGCDATSTCNINKVNSFNTFWSYMIDDFVGFAFTEYEDDSQIVASMSTGFANNDFDLTWSPRFVGPQQASVLLGPPRVRQLRVTKNGGCQVSKYYQHIFPDCYGPYMENTKSTATFKPRFAPSYIADAFEWKSEAFTGQALTEGNRADYGGDGYVVDLPWNASVASSLLGDLKEWNWIDESTRGVIIETTTLNTNVNVVVNTRVLFEFGVTGSVEPKVVSRAAPIGLLTPATSTEESLAIFIMQLLMLVFFTLFGIYTFWLMYKTCKNFVGDNPRKYISKQSWGGVMAFFLNTAYHYIRYAWNVVDLIILGLFIGHFIMRMETYTQMGAKPSFDPSVIGHPEKFVPFSSVMNAIFYSNNLLSLLAMLVWVKTFKYMCMSSYFRLLVRILEQCGRRLLVFAAILVCLFFGFSVAFFVGLGGSNDNHSELLGSFYVMFFLLIDGYDMNLAMFEPGQDVTMPILYFVYICLVNYVLLNIAAAIILDVYAITDRSSKDDKEKKNPMVVFLRTYYNMMLGVSLVHNDTEENMKSEDLSIRLDLLPGVVRRKWIEKKRRLQRIANETFAGMELYPVDLDPSDKEAHAPRDWMLPSSRKDVYDQMNHDVAKHPLSLYDIPEALKETEVSRAQLQSIMDEDETLPILLQENKAEKVIRRFKQASLAMQPLEDSGEMGEMIPVVQRLQAQIFTGVDLLEKVQFDEDLPEVPEITALTETMSDAVTSVRNKFRVELTGLIEATAVLFEHLVDLTQGVDVVRGHHEQVLDLVRETTEKELLRSLAKGPLMRR